MRDEDKTKEQLINDLASLRKSLRQCTTELQARNQDLDDVARYLISEFKSPLAMIIGFAELLEEEHAALSVEELRHCIRTIKQSGCKMSEMVNALLLLANSRRLFHVMFSGQNHAEKVDSAFGQRSTVESRISAPRGPFWALLATGTLGRAQESGIDFLEMNSVQAGL